VEREDMSFPGINYVCSMMATPASYKTKTSVIDIKAGNAGVVPQMEEAKFLDLEALDPPTQAQIDAVSNQLWTLVEHGAYYFIQSYLNDKLVIEVKGSTAGDRAVLQLADRLPVGNLDEVKLAENQLWTIVPAKWQDPGRAGEPSGYQIASVLDQNFVIDVKGANNAGGTVIELWKIKSTDTKELVHEAANQLWTFGELIWHDPLR
jgi:hypothetical protein